MFFFREHFFLLIYEALGAVQLLSYRKEYLSSKQRFSNTLRNRGQYLSTLENTLHNIFPTKYHNEGTTRRVEREEKGGRRTQEGTEARKPNPISSKSKPGPARRMEGGSELFRGAKPSRDLSSGVNIPVSLGPSGVPISGHFYRAGVIKIVYRKRAYNKHAGWCTYRVLEHCRSISRQNERYARVAAVHASYPSSEREDIKHGKRLASVSTRGKRSG